MRFDMAVVHAIHAGAGSYRNPKRPAGSVGWHQAFAGAVHRPAILVDALLFKQRRHHGKRNETRALVPHLAGFRRRPQTARRNHQQPVAVKRIKRAESDRGRPGPCRRLQPFIDHAELRHGRAHRREHRVAVTDQVDAIARARIRTEAPGSGRAEAHRVAVGCARFRHCYSASLSAKSPALASACSPARSAPASSSCSAAPEA